MNYTITLTYEGKQHSFLDDFNYEGWDELRGPDVQVTHMYTEGNYACDCNRSDFLYQYCGVDFSTSPQAELDDHYEGGTWTLPCGDTITLVSIVDANGHVVWPEPEPPTPPVFVQRASGLFVPT